MAEKKVVEIDGNSRGLDREMQRSKRLVQELRAEVDKLNVSLQAMGRSTLGTGGRSPGGFASNSPQSASGPVSPTNVLSGRILEQKRLFETIATGSKSALQTMTQALRTESTAQVQHIGRLRREVETLSQSYRQLERLHKDGLVDSGMLADGRAQLFDKAGQLNDATAHGRQLRMAELRTRSLAGGPGKWGARYEMGKEELRDFGHSIPGRLGIGPGVLQFGTAAAVGVAIGKVLVNTMKSGMQEASVAPHDYQNREIMRAQYGHAATAIRRGDLSLVYAMGMAGRDKRFQQDLALLGRGNDRTLSGFERAPGGGIMFNASGHRFLSAVGGAAWRGLMLDPVGGINQGRRDLANLPFETAAQSLQMAQRYQEMRPEEMARFQQFQANAAAHLATMQHLGIGAGYRDSKGKRLSAFAQNTIGKLDVGGGFGLSTDTAQYRDNAKRLLIAAQRRLITPEQLMGAHSEVESTGGLETAQRMRMIAAMGSRGHLYGAGQTLGMAAMGGDPETFWSHWNNMIGRGSGGVDVGAASTYGQVVGNSLVNGAGTTSGLGLLGAMSAYASGSSGAEEMMRARFAGPALASLGRTTTGALDPYQRGVNLLSAIHALPNASYGAQEYLAQLDPRLLIDVVGGGDKAVTRGMRLMGINSDAVREYWNSLQSRMLDRGIGMSPGQGGRMDAVQQQASALRAYNGSFSRYITDGSKGLSGKKRDEWLRDQFTARGLFFLQTGQVESEQIGEERARIEAGIGQYGTLHQGRKGRGVASYGSTSTEADRARTLADLDATENDKRETEDRRYRQTHANAGETANALSGVGNGGIRVDLANEVLLKLSKLLSQPQQLNVPGLPPIPRRLGANNSG